MIKKLKKRFILTSMAVVTLVLLLVSGALFIGARKVIYSDADQMLKRSLVLAFGGSGTAGEGRRGGRERAVVLTIDPETGAIENRTDGTLDNFSEEEQRALAKEAAQGKSLNKKGVRASVEKRNGKTYVAVVDTAMEDRLQAAAVKALALFAVGVWLALLLLVYLLSGWAVRPMAKAWDMQRQFVADASHDLKTPLTVILSNSELLRQQGESGDSPELERIQSAGKRMKDLVQKMLTLARMEDDPNRGAWESMDLSDMVMETALAFEAAAFEKGLTIEENVESDLVVKGNRAQVQSVVAAASRYPWRRRGRGRSSPSTTRAPTSPPRIYSTCSSASIGRTRATPRGTAPAWAWPSWRAWWRPWAAPSPPKAAKLAAPPSRRCCPGRTAENREPCICVPFNKLLVERDFALWYSFIYGYEDRVGM